MKVLITHVYSEGNAGDSALTRQTILAVQKQLHPASIALLSASPKDSIQDVKVLPSLLFWVLYENKNTFIRLWRLCLLLICAPLLGIKGGAASKLKSLVLPKNLYQIIQSYEDANAVVAVAGGYLNSGHSKNTKITFIIQWLGLWLAVALGKTLYLYNQSIGPFAGALEKHLIVKVLNKAKVVIVRESLSYNYLAMLGVQKSCLKLSTDSAFTYRPKITPTLAQTTEDFLRTGNIVGISVRRWLTTAKQEKYEEALASFIDYLTGNNFKVVLVPQVCSPEHNDDDREVAQRVFLKLQNPSQCLNIQTVLTVDEVYKILSLCHIVVGTRMHAVIFALSASVPSLAIAYERKTYGVMEDIGLKEFVLGMEEVDHSRLVDLFTKIWENKKLFSQNINTILGKQKQLLESTDQYLKA